jgi:hypothetical protein
MEIKKDSTDISVYFHLRNSTDGTSKTGLLYNSAGAVASYVRNRAARAAITLATLASASAAHSDGGFILVDDTNTPGLYRLDLPDAAVATGVDSVVINIGFTGVFGESLNIELVDNIEKDSYDILNNGTYGNAQLVRSTTPANTMDIEAGGTVGIDFNNTNGTHPNVTVGTNNDKTGYSISGTKTTLDALNDVSTAQVNAECDTALTDYDGPTNAEMTARTIPSADYFDPAADTVANVTTVATLTGHTAQTGDSYPIVTHATYGLEVIKRFVRNILIRATMAMMVLHQRQPN